MRWRRVVRRALARLDARAPVPVTVAPPGRVLAASTAVVTGAAGRLGQALVAALGDTGADVWGLDRLPVAGLPAERELRGDLTDAGHVEAAAAAVRAAHPAGAPLVLLHAAGGMAGVHATGLAAAPAAVWAEAYAANVVGPVQLVRALAPAMGPGSGVVLVTSVNAGIPSPWPHYAASKAALEQVVLDLAAALAPQGIRVNAVAPARFRAGPAVATNEHTPLLGTDIPIEAVVNACLFLADPQSSPATTGVSLRVDGGLALDHRRLRDG
jgi:3-oxoacyl-[acyl-carrier protein] reductase/meso-butanediol dehydrogenase/(S,S)-butanediol dehydrogenase/diacetyl reductase